MTVLITGGTGFIGLNLAEALLARGERVVLVALDALPHAAVRAFRTLPGSLAVEIADVRDGTALRTLFRRHSVTRLFPFAAITSGPERERAGPYAVFDVNLLGLIAQLEAARDAGVRRVIVPSSAAVYGESYYGREEVDETTGVTPATLYGVSKFAAERTGLRLGQLWQLDVIAARIGAAFGPWERETGLRDTLSPFWLAARMAQDGHEAVLPADWPAYGAVYSRDVASGLVWLMDNGTAGERVFNVCSDMQVGSAMRTWCARLTSRYPAFRFRSSAAPSEVNIRALDTRPRARLSPDRLAQAGWRARFDADRACDDYLDWLLADRP